MFDQFKKHYYSYFIGIIIPAVVNFLTIPIFKNRLSAADFGIYSFYFSIILFINAPLSGGITQSIIRLHVEAKETSVFFMQCLLISLTMQLLLGIPLFFYVQATSHAPLFSLLFVLAFSVANLYTTLTAITQANLFSGSSAIAESIRSLSFFGTSLLLLYFASSIYFVNAIFIGLVCSYCIATGYLISTNNVKIEFGKDALRYKEIKATAGAMANYGGYLVMWFFFSYIISSGSRFILAHYNGKENIGDFTAEFDIINKSIVLLLSPVLISLFPLLVKAYSSDNLETARKIINKITLIELVLMAVVLVGFLSFGFSFLNYILKIPSSDEHLQVSVQVIVSTFLWQIAMLQQKYLELQKKTYKMVVFIFIASIFSLSADFYFISKFGVAFAGIGFNIGALIYLIQIVRYKKQIKYK